MHETYTRAAQKPNCRGRYCLRECTPARLNTIQRRFGGVARSPIVSIADEKPKQRWCNDRCRLVPEVLKLDGFTLRGERIPVIDGGRETIRNVVGSVGKVKQQGGQLVGTIAWARDDRSQETKAKWEAGHLEGIFEAEIVPTRIVEYGVDDTYQGMRGPVDVVTRWAVVAVRIRAAHGGD